MKSYLSENIGNEIWFSNYAPPPYLPAATALSKTGQVSRCTVSELSEEEGRLLASRSLSAPFNCSAVRGGKLWLHTTIFANQTVSVSS